MSLLCDLLCLLALDFSDRAAWLKTSQDGLHQALSLSARKQKTCLSGLLLHQAQD